MVDLGGQRVIPGSVGGVRYGVARGFHNCEIGGSVMANRYQ